MATTGNWPVGVCTWSLQMGITDVAGTLDDLGVTHVHLAVGPAVEPEGGQYIAVVKEQAWTITATMIDFPQEDYSTLETIRKSGGVVPDQFWPANRERFLQAAEVTARLGVPFLSMHAGFIEPEAPVAADKIRERIVSLADASAAQGVTLLLETGQETAEEMRKFLEALDHPSLGVNLDPANMILYDKGNPVEAVHTLAPWNKHVHIKDALYTQKPGTWGTEVPWGEGEVDDQAFLRALKEINYSGALAIEREAGNQRVNDIRSAIERLV